MIRMDSIAYRYHPGLPPALTEVTCRLDDGSFHFLTGPSGAGKTTLLRLLQMDILPTQGRLELFGEDVAAVSRETRARLRRRVGLVFQDFRLLNHLTVQENVALPLWLAGTPDALQLRAVNDMLTWVGLSDKLDVPAERLSGGEKQRVALARAVVHRPDLVIADEPTGSVDAAMGRRVMHLLTELNRQGTTVILATPDATLWQTYNHPLLRLENGRLDTGAMVHLETLTRTEAAS